MGFQVQGLGFHGFQLLLQPPVQKPSKLAVSQSQRKSYPTKGQDVEPVGLCDCWAFLLDSVSLYQEYWSLYIQYVRLSRLLNRKPYCILGFWYWYLQCRFWESM